MQTNWRCTGKSQTFEVTRSFSFILQVGLLHCVAAFFQHASPGQLEHSRPLAAWALGACSSRHAAVRSAAAAQAAGLLASPQFVLALYHEGPHPIHTRDRAQAVEGHDCKILQARGWVRGE